MKPRNYQSYIERKKRDTEVLKGAYDISHLTGKIDRLKDEIERDTDRPKLDITTKINKLKPDILKMIRDCEKLYSYRDTWYQRLMNIDLFAAEAESQIKQLEGEVDSINPWRHAYGYTAADEYSAGDLLRIKLGRLSTALFRMGLYCSQYQDPL